MYCVGLTGPIASGKSTVARLFSELGATVINADEIARQLTEQDQPALRKIVQHFGKEFLDEQGHLQRRMLRDYIFQHPTQRKWLENVLHPLIREKIQAQIQKPTQLYYMLEIPLLTDKANYPYLNRVLLVLADTKIQIQRIMQRDHHSQEQAENIIKAQADHSTYQEIADDTIINTGNQDDLNKQVLYLHHQYCLNSTNK